MPTIIQLRTWCKNCEDFEVHNREYICLVCGTEFTEISIAEIPTEKVLEQRERYIECERKKSLELFNSMLILGTGRSSFFNSFSSNYPRIKIIETDAGQKEIEKRKKKKREDYYAKKKRERQAFELERAKYRKLGRNEKCLCGSNKKYKKCCYAKYG